MFDPTIYDNVKVVLEGAVYDMDLNGQILVTQRIDQIDLSSMSRYFAISFQQIDMPDNIAEISLRVHLRDLAAEILEQPHESPSVNKHIVSEGNERLFTPGCHLLISFITKILDPHQECPLIQSCLANIWQHRPQITQRLSYMFDEQPKGYENQIDLRFGRKIDEAQLDDFPELIQYAIASLAWLNERKAK
jgi:hypothetical protein